MTIRILLIDDHTLFRSGVRALLQRQPDFEVVDDAADGIEDIARELDLAESTVKIHVRNVLRKLNVSSRVQIAIHALARELND